MHRWREIKVGGQILFIGADNYPFPIPLGKNAASHGYSIRRRVEDEILARRIGKDELTAIAASSALPTPKRNTSATQKQYAQKFVSDEGKQDGLYWAVMEGQAASPFEDVRDFAKAAGYTNAGDKAQAFGGYYLQDLDQAGPQG